MIEKNKNQWNLILKIPIVNEKKSNKVNLVASWGTKRNGFFSILGTLLSHIGKFNAKSGKKPSKMHLQFDQTR